MPTLLELADGTYPAKFNGGAIPPLEGQSLTPIFAGEQRVEPASLCWALFGNRAIRQGNWKLVWGASDRRWELYDLAEDRTETLDLASQFPERVKAMADDWQEWAEKTEVSP